MPIVRTPRRHALTPEQRRFLNTPRAPSREPESDALCEEIAAEPEAPMSVSAPREEPKPRRMPSAGSAPPRLAAAPVAQVEKASRTLELQHAIIIIGALFLLGLTFYVGTKYNYLKYLIATRHEPTLAEKHPDPFRACRRKI